MSKVNRSGVIALIISLFVVMLVTSPGVPAEAAQTGPGCLVGDTCPPQRLVSPSARCIRVEAVGGATPLLEADCTNRYRALQQANRQVQFRSNGEVRLHGMCLESNGQDQPPALRTCDQTPEQQWSVSATGQVMDSSGDCLIETAGFDVHVASCGSVADSRWGFIPIDREGNYSVKGVYIVATDSATSGRSQLIVDALAQIRSDWAAFGFTFTLDPTPLIISGVGITCADIPTLAEVRKITVRELSLRREFSYNTKYNAAAECATPGAANAGIGVAVYAQWILNFAQAQIGMDRSSAADGSMAEVGVFGHELGHTFDIPHEKCIIGSWQGGLNEGGTTIASGAPDVGTRSFMCNGAYYPNNDPAAEYQRSIFVERGCRWFSECVGTIELGDFGRPYGCGIGGDGNVYWDANAGSSVVLHRFTYQEGVVTESLPVPSDTGFMTPQLQPGVDNYFAVAAAGAPIGQRVRCGKIAGPSTGGPDGDGDGVSDTDDACPETPPGTAINAFGCSLSEQEATCDGLAVTINMQTNGGQGNGTPNADVILGTNGNDQIFAQDGDDVICTLDGDDEVFAGPGNDRVFGGDGADRLFGEDGSDRLEGGDGEDHLDGGAGPDSLLGQGDDDEQYGWTGDDILRGGDGLDFIRGGDGDDQLFGEDGNDQLLGDAGEDQLYGDAGNDALRGGPDPDELFGGDGDDDLVGEEGNDLIRGGAGADQISGEEGNDELFGDAGPDAIYGGDGADSIAGGTSDDQLFGGPGNDVQTGGDGDDIVYGDGGEDELFGDAGDDELYGGPDDDTIQGGDGGDLVGGNEGNDDIDGGAGVDVLYGDDGADLIRGEADADQIFGGLGDDKLFGGQGADLIRGDAGNDTLHGNRGADELYGDEDDDRIFGYSQNDQIYGGPGNDRLHGNFGDDIVNGEGGDDNLFGYGNNDTLDGGPGNDLMGGNFGDDVLFGQDGNDTMYGSDGADRLFGGPGNDSVAGNSGNDFLGGDEGNDALDGGINVDECFGDAGTDTATRCETVAGVP